MTAGPTWKKRGFEHPSASTRSYNWGNMFGVTGFSAVGPTVMLLSNQPPQLDNWTMPVRVSMFAPISVDLHERLEARIGLHFTSCYGLSEAVPPVFQPLSVPSRPGSAGVRNQQFDVRVFHETDHEVPTASWARSCAGR